jgi:hypothetical protein
VRLRSEELEPLDVVFDEDDGWRFARPPEFPRVR